MKIGLKKGTIVLGLALVLGLSACTDDLNDSNTRTEAQELSELKVFLEQVKEEGHVLDSTELGIYYIVDSLGTGPTAQEGDTCFIKYTGILLDGTIFDDSGFHQSNKDGIWEFVFKESSLIPGFEDGLKIMNKGAKIDIIIPSSLAYGEFGSYPYIAPYTTLIFGLRMEDLKPAVTEE